MTHKNGGFEKKSFLLFSLLLTFACSDGPFTRSPAFVVSDLRKTAPAQRRFAAFQSIVQRGRCSDTQPPPGGTIQRSRCEVSTAQAPSRAQLADIAEAIALAREGDANATYAVALADVLWGAKDKKLDQSIGLFRDVVQRVPSGEFVHLDLSAAYLQRAEEKQQPADLVSALEEASLARHGDASEFAQFNEALALERLEFRRTAAKSWTQLARFSRNDIVRGESRARQSHASERKQDEPQRDTKILQAKGWSVLLPAWGRALLSGDLRNADSLLSEAHILAQQISSLRGDRSLAMAIEAIDQLKSDSRMLPSLARAHIDYAAAESLFAKLEPEAARILLERSMGSANVSPSLYSWMNALHAVTLVPAGHALNAEIQLNSIHDDPSVREMISLRARCAYILGVMAGRRADFARAIPLLRESVAGYQSVNEFEPAGTALFGLSEALFEIGQFVEAYVAAHAGLTVLATTPSSVARHNILQTLVRVAILEGRPHAALKIAEEDVAMVDEWPLPAHAVEAFMAHARVLLQLGRSSDAREDLMLARAKFPQLTSGAREFLESDMLLIEAAADPNVGSIEAGQKIAQVMSDSVRRANVPRLMVALRARVNQRLAALDTSGALADLDTLAQLIQRRQELLLHLGDRAAIMGMQEAVFGQMASLEIALGHDDLAMVAIERGRQRVMSSNVRASISEGSMANERSRRASVVLAFTGDTLRIWTRINGRTQMISAYLPEHLFLKTEIAANTALRRKASSTIANPHLARLYDWIVRPIAPQLTAEIDELKFVAYGSLSDVPFDAMYDAQSKRYLVERFSIQESWSTNDPPRTDDKLQNQGHVLVVANPSFTPADYPTLEPLTGADEEGVSVARMYPNSVTLAGAGATKSALMREFPKAAVIHFAGHALIDEVSIDRSQLVMEGGALNAVSARELSAMDLHGARLIVLSACSGRSESRAAGASVADLAGAILAAGAGSVVASPWPVEDRTTLQ
ncbi:MAG: CHAT domain-containing protein, partial [Gemmatimonadaceae bacterium]